MPSRQVAAVATVIACTAAALSAADDITLTYTYEETAEGRDIHEGIYGSHGAGEFDEWRLRLGLAPGMDRVQIKTDINGQPYPGPGDVETDKVINDPALPPRIALDWILGDYERGDSGWFASLGIEYTRREYQILYGIGAASPPLNLHALNLRVGMGYAWYLTNRFRYEFEPYLSGGLMWTELDLIDLSVPAPAIEVSGGPVFETGVRNSLIWHPAKTQAWHLGASVDYVYGYAQTIYESTGSAGDIRSEVRFWWYGLGYSLFYGAKF
jgi:hypothetical protein